MELYVNKKKVDMLQDPATYLSLRIKALLKAASGISDIYKNVMIDVVKGIAGTSTEYKAAAGQPWVKLLTCDLTTKVKSEELGIIAIHYPILESDYKAQKSKNSRELEAKKEFIKEGLRH